MLLAKITQILKVVFIMNEKIIELKNEIAKAVIGQEQMIDALLIGLLTNGHILLEGVPGLAKTTTVKEYHYLMEAMIEMNTNPDNNA